MHKHALPACIKKQKRVSEETLLSDMTICSFTYTLDLLNCSNHLLIER